MSDDQTFLSDGARIRFVRGGEGEPVVLVHGFSLDAETNWIEPGTFAVLAAEHDVVAVDLRGHGRSDKPHDPAMYGVRMAEDVLRLLDHLGLESAHLAGYSMGAGVVLQLLVAAPERLRSAILGGQGRRPPQSLQAALPAVARALAAGEGFSLLLEALERPGAAGMSAAERSEWNERLTARNDQQALAAVLGGMADSRPIGTEELRANRVPTLAVIGEADVLLESVQELAAELACVEIEMLPGLDHIGAVGDPRLGESMLAFLRRQRS